MAEPAVLEGLGRFIAPCMAPEGDAEYPDIPIGQHCPEHNRTVYLCLDLGILWCDGYPGSGDGYRPHEMFVYAGGDLDWDPDWETVGAGDVRVAQ